MLKSILSANKGGAETTHVGMGDPIKGAFCFPQGSEQLHSFQEEYARTVSKGWPVSIVERHTPTCPIIVDIDMRSESKDMDFA